MSMVTVIAAPSDGAAAVVSAPPPTVVSGAAAAVVSGAAAAVVSGAAAVSLEPPSPSLPHDAATRARPTARAANRVLRFVILTWVFLLCERREVGLGRDDKASENA
jgi:hypothetical protein